MSYLSYFSKFGRDDNWNSKGKGNLSTMIGSSPFLVVTSPNPALVVLKLTTFWPKIPPPYSIGHSWESKGNPVKSKLQEKVSWNLSSTTRFIETLRNSGIFGGSTILLDESVSPNDGLFLNSISCSNSMTGCQINPDSSSVRSQSLEKKIKVSVTNTFIRSNLYELLLFCLRWWNVW